ncbi:PAF acetylhydrolase [Myriangium duriaei CBS 260.36]|uniref:Putative phospholipase n=1 Tax=Myriangium duriaei CBS 260.36 TaxID=1168546 RepID=A0A9P4J5E7_9PEZI|nr:PAF acetylhydrolase [Myriangium duriaei CBS 260.36]
MVIPAILEPRLTWRYVLVSGAVLYGSYCWLLGLPLLSSNLPKYTGPHAVGTIDLEVPVDSRRVSDLIYANTREPAFELKTVLFSIYYPASATARPSRTNHYWIPKPLAITAEGYAKFAHISNFFTNAFFTVALWAIAGGNRIPAKVDLPLLDPAGRTHDGTWPVVVFSHGMASSRTSYTQWCGELASRGYIVAAVEHRDGSCPGSMIMRKGEEEEMVMHTSEAQLRLGDSRIETAQLKTAQLDFRQAEVEETVKVFRLLNSGKGDGVYQKNSRDEGATLQGWTGKLLVENMTIAGHSYGATLALQALKGGPSRSLPFSGAIVLDPGKQSGRLNDDVRVPTLIVHSQSWSKTVSMFFGRPHFDTVKELTEGILSRGNKAWFMTSLGTSHPSVTDAPLLEPLLLSWTTGSTIDAHEGLRQYVHVSTDLLKYQHEGIVSGLLSYPVDSPQYENRLERNLPGHDTRAKYWQIHVAPSSNKAQAA